nr:hypothetical protein [Paramuribaculum intestinale]
MAVGAPAAPAISRGESHDGAHRGAYRQRYETCGQKHARQQQLRRKHTERQRHSGVDRADLLGHRGEGTRKHEDPDHVENVAVAGRTGEHADAIAQTPAHHHADTPRRCGRQRHGYGHLVEVADHGRYSHVERQENYHGRQGEPSAPRRY